MISEHHDTIATVIDTGLGGNSGHHNRAAAAGPPQVFQLKAGTYRKCPT
jgi:hypothetical protein